MVTLSQFYKNHGLRKKERSLPLNVDDVPITDTVNLLIQEKEIESVNVENKVLNITSRTHYNNVPDTVQIVIPNKQNFLDVRIPLIKIIGKNLNSDQLFKTPKNYGYLMSLAVSLNFEGKIDTVYFSAKLSPEILQILKPMAIISKKIMESNLSFKEYKNKVVLFPIFFARSGDQLLAYKNGFLSGLSGLWPVFNLRDQKKPLVLLDPFFNMFFDPVE